VKLEVLALWIGFGLYLSNLALGVGVQFRWVSTKRFHWVHHALYGVVFVAAGAATLTAILAGSRWWVFLPTLLALGLLPRFRGGSLPHRNLALVGLCGYVLALI
jgi:sterol desaturase/sphingolipid hydroxylase (fatty acid hydroxylase superfamily)